MEGFGWEGRGYCKIETFEAGRPGMYFVIFIVGEIVCCDRCQLRLLSQ
jgi:hypothetical protein